MSKGEVRCMNCGHRQGDRGRRATCEICGTAPVQSAEYPEGHVCHPSRPRFKTPTVREIVEHARKQRKLLEKKK